MISHTHGDKPVPFEVAMFLSVEGVDVAFDQWDVALGDSVAEFMESSLAEADFVILIWSEKAATSKWVTRERQAAITSAVNTGSPKVIVIRIDDHPLPPFLSDLKYHRWHGGTEADRNEIVNGILGHRPGSEYVRAVVRKAEELTIDSDSGHSLPYKACPRCGSSRLTRRQVTDYAHDRLYHFIDCDECGWGDWSE